MSDESRKGFEAWCVKECGYKYITPEQYWHVWQAAVAWSRAQGADCEHLLMRAYHDLHEANRRIDNLKQTLSRAQGVPVTRRVWCCITCGRHEDDHDGEDHAPDIRLVYRCKVCLKTWDTDEVLPCPECAPEPAGANWSIRKALALLVDAVSQLSDHFNEPASDHLAEWLALNAAVQRANAILAEPAGAKGGEDACAALAIKALDLWRAQQNPAPSGESTTETMRRITAETADVLRTCGIEGRYLECNP